MKKSWPMTVGLYVAILAVLHFSGLTKFLVSFVTSNITSQPEIAIEETTFAETLQEEVPFSVYAPPEIEPKDIYLILLLGDSMTHALGPHGGKFSELLHQKFPGKAFIVDNYSYSSNVLTVQTRFDEETTVWGLTFDPISQREFDLMVIESYGYNPLSHLGVEEGLIAQTEELTAIMTRLEREKPEARVMFFSTIAPNKQKYAQGVQAQPVEESITKAEERSQYLVNHLVYAREHSIPSLDIYSQSLNQAGDGDLTYINPDDYIHPSHLGVEFIAEKLAEFIYENNVLPRE